MKQQHTWGGILVALAVGLCLVATDAFAQSTALTEYPYEIINSSGETVQGRCSGGTWTDVANGTTQEFECQYSVHVRAAGSASYQSVGNGCRPGLEQEITVTEASAGSPLVYTLSCDDYT